MQQVTQQVLIKAEKDGCGDERELEELFSGRRQPGTTSTWQSDHMREIATQSMRHWALTHLRHWVLGKVAAPQFVHVCYMSSWVVLIFYTYSAFQTLLDGSVSTWPWQSTESPLLSPNIPGFWFMVFMDTSWSNKRDAVGRVRPEHQWTKDCIGLRSVG